MEWLNRSEVLAGKVLNGDVSPHAVEPHILHDPYDRMVSALKDGATEAELLDVVGMVALDQAKVAAKKVNGDNEIYVEACRESANRVRIGNELTPIVKRWITGASREEDIIKAKAAMEMIEHEKVYTTPLSEAEDLGNVWRKTGYEPWDKYFKGIPESSLTVIGAAPGSGKTSALGRLLLEGIRMGKTSLFFSLEMNKAQVKYRFSQLDSKLLGSKKNQSKLLVADGALSLSEIYAEAGRVAAQTDLHLIGVDFADMIIPEKWRKGSVELVDETYRTLAALAKQVDVPVIVLSQLNANYLGGRPRVNHLRGSRLIEALGAMVVLLYNPNQIDVLQSDPEFYVDSETGWFVQGKSRYGFTGEGPLAVAVKWGGKTGWGEATGRTMQIFAV